MVSGTTLGMVLAEVPAVFIGGKLATRILMKLEQSIAAAIFAILGAATLSAINCAPSNRPATWSEIG